jgi:ATP-dependent DNA helicase RecQ
LLPKAFDFLRHEEASCIVVIVSPLIALMQDQVRAMTERKVSAVYAGKADDKLEADICSGKYQLVYFSPESLLLESRWRDMLQSPTYCERLVGLAVDEAHCVKKW